MRTSVRPRSTYPDPADLRIQGITVKTIPEISYNPIVDGFTLVEVLLALVILSVGMLGIAGLHVHGLQAGRTALFRHQAVMLAGDIADRIRANPTAGAAYTIAGAKHGCVSGGIDCVPVEMAQHDISLWSDQAETSLPAGNVNINFDGSASPGAYEITVSWNEAGQVRRPQYQINVPVLGF